MAGSSPKRAVAVDFLKIGEEALDVVERVRPLGMARKLHALPGGIGFRTARSVFRLASFRLVDGFVGH